MTIANCQTVGCTSGAPASVRCLWPGKTVDLCGACAKRAAGVANAMGFTLNVAIIDAEALALEELAAMECAYCKLPKELRPYGVNNARICFQCAMLPANKANTEQVMRARFDSLGDAVTIGDPDGPRDMTAADLSDPAVEIFVTDPESKVHS